MEPVSPGIIELLQTGGVLAMLLIVIFSGLKGWWVWGWQYRKREEELAQERDEWKKLALGGTKLAQESTEITKDTISQERKRVQLLEEVIKVLSRRDETDDH